MEHLYNETSMKLVILTEIWMLLSDFGYTNIYSSKLN